MVPQSSLLVALVDLIESDPESAGQGREWDAGWPSAGLLGPAVLEGAGDHAGAQRLDGQRAARDPGAADLGDAGAAGALERAGPLPDASDLGAPVGDAAGHPAGADRVPGAAPGRADRPVGRRAATRRDRQHGAARAEAASGTRSIATPAWSRTPRSTPRPAGPSPAGTAGSTAGSSTWSPPSRRSGSRWPPN